LDPAITNCTVNVNYCIYLKVILHATNPLPVPFKKKEYAVPSTQILVYVPSLQNK
jgi:hypothetical protein